LGQSIQPEENEPKIHHFHHDLHHKPHIGDKHDLTGQETIQAASTTQERPSQAQAEVFLEASENKKEQSIINTSSPVLPSPPRTSVPYQKLPSLYLPPAPPIQYQQATQQGPQFQYQLTTPTQQQGQDIKDKKEESSSDSSSSSEESDSDESESDCDSRDYECKVREWRKRQEEIMQMQQAYVQAECENLSKYYIFYIFWILNYTELSLL
jgi:hypothetical protein